MALCVGFWSILWRTFWLYNWKFQRFYLWFKHFDLFEILRKHFMTLWSFLPETNTKFVFVSICLHTHTHTCTTDVHRQTQRSHLDLLSPSSCILVPLCVRSELDAAFAEHMMTGIPSCSDLEVILIQERRMAGKTKPCLLNEWPAAPPPLTANSSEPRLTSLSTNAFKASGTAHLSSQISLL